MKRALIVFGKRPQAGTVKTRLTPQLTDGEAADLYKAFVADALEQYSRLGPDVRFYLAGQGVDDWQMPVNARRLPQRGDGLGERMTHAFAETFSDGYDQAVIIGTDHPTLPMRYVEDAFVALEEQGTVVIGPAEDGGYYLLGLTEERPELFQQMNYSHDGVFTDTLERIGGGAVTVLPEWYDVDRPEELARLHAELSAQPDRAPHTHTTLLELASRHNWLCD